MTKQKLKLESGEELLYDFVSFDGESIVFEVCGIIQRKSNPPKVRYLSKEQIFSIGEVQEQLNNSRFLTNKHAAKRI